jgi:hypothetical protein
MRRGGWCREQWKRNSAEKNAAYVQESFHLVSSILL